MIFLIEDLNARVGRKDEVSVEVLRSQGENVRNGNECRLINYCIDNDTIISNTFFAHNEIYKIIREKSIIDYIIVEKTQKERHLKTSKTISGQPLRQNKNL